MIIINKRWALSSNKHNIILMQKGDPEHRMAKKNAEYHNAYFFSSLHNVLSFLVEQEVRDSDLVSLESVCDKIDEVKGLIKSMPNITISDLRGNDDKEDE